MSLQEANRVMRRWLADRPHVRAAVDSADTAMLMAAIAAYGDVRVQHERSRSLAIIAAWQPTGRASGMDALADAINADQPGAPPE